MKTLPLLFTILAATVLGAYGSQNSLTTIYQPLDPMADGTVVVREVPFVTGGAYPEVFFTAITRPHIPQQFTQAPVGDINVASRAGLSLSCESAATSQKKLYITWDFSKADPKALNEDLIKALIECLEKTSGKSIVLYSKFIAADKYPQFRKLIEARFPPQTEQQRKEDSSTQTIEATAGHGDAIPKSVFPKVDGIFTKGEFIDLSDPKGERLYIRYGPISDSGVELERINGAGKVIWLYQVAPLGVSHSKYRHEVWTRIEGKKIWVTSIGAKTINEVIDLETGKQASRSISESKR